MNGKRAKKIHKLVVNKFPTLLLMVRKYYGDETKTMNERRVYRIAKKMWTNKTPGVEKWI